MSARVAVPAKVRSILKKRSKIRLDVGGGDNPNHGWIVMDIRKRDTVHIVHDVEKVPWPLPDGSCSVVQMSHLWEHISPKRTLAVADECWRVLEPGGQWWLITPHAWSVGFIQDPTHCNPTNEVTFHYFDPRFFLYTVYKPKPWRIIKLDYQIVGNIETAMVKDDPRKAKKLLDKAMKEYQKAMAS